VAVAVVGHAFPVWLRFRGGKSVATACGGFVILAPLATVIAALVYPVVVSLTRISSVGSLSATAVLAVATWATGRPRPVQLAAALVGAFIVARHAQNIGRLARGVEPRLARSAPAGSAREGGRS
jgi:glycerol-3-phosphate acyltransferase PlsY